MGKQIIVSAVFNADGSLNVPATDEAYSKLRDTLAASVAEDFNSVAVDITTYLLQLPKLRTVPTQALIRGLWEAKAESGQLKGKTHEEKAALYARLEEVVPEYVKSNSDMFHTGRKMGIAIRYVPGETVKDSDGKELLDPKTGETTQAFRHTDEEWTKITAVKEKAADNKQAA